MVRRRIVLGGALMAGLGLLPTTAAAVGAMTALAPNLTSKPGWHGDPSPASLPRCRDRNPHGRRAEQVAASIVEGSNPSSPQLHPRELVIGHGDLWVLARVVRQRSPGFDVQSSTWALGKFPWFRVNVGRLTVQGHRLDGPGTFRADLPPEGSYPTGFMPSSLDFSTGGCWEITARLRRTTITFFIAFSSSHQALCADLARQLQNPTLNTPENQGVAQLLRSTYEARACH